MGQAFRGRDREGENRALEGATLAELAKKPNKDPLDCILDFALSESLDTMFVAQLLHNDDKAGARPRPIPTPTSHCRMPARISPSSAMRASACT